MLDVLMLGLLVLSVLAAWRFAVACQGLMTP